MADAFYFSMKSRTFWARILYYEIKERPRHLNERYGAVFTKIVWERR